MGTIMSPVAAIDNIWWAKKRKGRAHKAESVVIVPGSHGQYDILVAKLADGSFVCSRDLSKFAYMPGDYHWTKPVMEALTTLGAITADDMKAHLDRCDEIDAAREKQYAAENLRDTLAAHGMAPSADQSAFIDAHGKRPPRSEVKS